MLEKRNLFCLLYALFAFVPFELTTHMPPCLSILMLQLVSRSAVVDGNPHL